MTHGQTIHPFLALKLVGACRPQTQKRVGGFTLIETIVVLLLIGILFAIAAPSYFTWVNNKRVEDALTQVLGALKEAQSEALRKGKSCFVEINNRTVRATTLPPASENCLPTGRRDLNPNSTVQITTNFQNTPPPPNPDRRLIFTYKKTTPNGGIIVLSSPDASRRRCIVVSTGIGIIRTGYYNPAAPLDETQCMRNP